MLYVLSLPGLHMPGLTKEHEPWQVSQTNNISIATNMIMAIYFINDNDINTNDNNKTDSPI